MENNQYIQAFLKNNDPSHEETANAYHQRDLLMNINFENAFHNATSKLCLNEENMEKLIDCQYKSEINNRIKKFFKNKNNGLDLNINYQNYFDNMKNSNKYIELKNKYTNLTKYLNNKDHLGFYKALTLYDLGSIGF